MILEGILIGITYGIFLAILVGPLLMTLVNTTIKSGPRKGMLVASGIWLSDILIILLLFNAYQEWSTFFTDDVIKILGMIAMVTFMAVGIMYFIKGKANNESNLTLPDKPFYYFSKGIFLNTVNPFTFVFWTTLAANHLIIKNKGLAYGIALFTATMFVIIVTDALKVLLAHKISPILKSNMVRYLQYFTAILFIISGIYIGLKAYGMV